MAIRRFAQTRPFFALALVIALWLVLPAILKTVLRTGFHELHAPAVTAVSVVRDVQDYWSYRAQSKDELIEAIRDLARQRAHDELRLQEAEALEREVERLEALLELPPLPGYRFEVARVARRESGAWGQRVIIRKGRNHGIAAGAPVVFNGGVAGKVTEVYYNTAVVELISSPTLRLSARIDDDDRPVTYQGAVAPPFAPAVGVAEFVPLDIRSPASAPRRLVTSGLGGVFPRGLFIGELIALEPSPDGLFQTGRVRLDEDLNRLYEVAVLLLENGGQDEPQAP